MYWLVIWKEVFFAGFRRYYKVNEDIILDGNFYFKVTVVTVFF